MSAPLGADGKAVEFTTVQAAEQPAHGAQLAGAASGTIGLALSGGGIRSATFSLGVLQALAGRQRLASFDYLSTVSGGGYIGAWLSAWIHRAGLATVQDELGRLGATGDAEPGSAEAPPVQWLRRYSNYLTPRVGLFSSDALTVMSIWLRNVVLTLIVVFLVFAVVVMLPRLALLHLIGSIEARSLWLGYTAIGLGCGLLPAVMMANLVRLRRPDEGSRWLATPSGVAWTVVLPGVLAATAASAWLFGHRDGQPLLDRSMLITGGLLIAVVTALWLAAEMRPAPGQARRTRAPRWQPLRELYVYAQAIAVALACGGGALWAMHRGWPYDGGVGGALALFTLGPAAFLMVAGLAGWIFVGLVGRVFYERSREWWSSMNALFMSAATLLLLVNLCAFYLPALAAAVWHSTWLRGLFGSGWLGSLLLVWLGPRKSAAPPQTRFSMISLANAGAIVGMVGFIVAASFLTDFALAKAADALGAPLPGGLYPDSLPGFVDRHVAALCAEFKLAPLCLPFLWWAFLATALAMAVFGQRVDVNKFSLHNMYKNRLIRCYLGASRGTERKAHPFTGFDEADDLPLRDLASRERPQRPYHIFNTALNLSQGKNLAWQERKAAAFALTPLYCGFGLSGTQGELSGKLGQPNGVSRFRPTAQYAARDGEEPGITLGMAMATSGAAASPNGGIHTRPALAFMMTLLNLRLGRWSPNPACTSWRSPSPLFGVMYLLQELFGFSNDTSRYVNLSDGGHFENTGIYELVRRRCRVIVVVDAGADGERGFDDLGRAIRQCRIDFGVEIDINLATMRLGKEELPASGVASGSIDYGAGFAKGTLVVIKPTLCAARLEPTDVLNYATRNPTFPQQSTADQFFDESQFESYRQLGLFLGKACLDASPDLLPLREIGDLGAAHAQIARDKERRRRWLERLWPALPWAAAGLLLLLTVFNNTCLSPEWNVLRATRQCGLPEPAVAAALTAGCPRAFFLHLDSIFVLFYSASFMVGQCLFLRAALKPASLARRYPALLALALGLALGGGLADLVENTLVLNAMTAAGGCLAEAPPTPFWTTAKFVLFGINLALLLVVRWRARERGSQDAAGGSGLRAGG